MYYAFYCKNRQDSLEYRRYVRPNCLQHLKLLEENNRLLIAVPIQRILMTLPLKSISREEKRGVTAATLALQHTTDVYICVLSRKVLPE
ncbi:MAG: hypothetical protein AB8Z26_01440 [Coxiella-like endosymbiont]